MFPMPTDFPSAKVTKKIITSIQHIFQSLLPPEKTSQKSPHNYAFFSYKKTSQNMHNYLRF
jgi:hypothetical protein